MGEIVTKLMGMNWVEVGQAVLMIVGGAAILAKITPWDWDDKAVGWLTKLLRKIGMQKD